MKKKNKSIQVFKAVFLTLITLFTIFCIICGAVVFANYGSIQEFWNNSYFSLFEHIVGTIGEFLIFGIVIYGICKIYKFFEKGD